jgi:Protein of unknown function (DUF2001).
MPDYSAKRVMSGSWGQVFLDGELVTEATAFQAKFTFNKTDISIGGQMETDSKVTSIKGTGSITMNRINSRMLLLLGDKISDGRDVRFTIICKLADPDAGGSERMALTEVSFDDLTIADWTSGQPGTITAPFTFAKMKMLDTVVPS